MRGKNVSHLHGAEPRQNVLVQAVPVTLAGRRFENVVGEPSIVDVRFERDLADVACARMTCPLSRLGGLPGDVCVSSRSEGTGGAPASSSIFVVGRVARTAVTLH